ncbi:hypothetical protein DFH06DRAFT_448806 [Mycena polygramma]|nr:hypothetical protein DFH06DRAFT_448806 [Mycena polygramma]
MRFARCLRSTRSALFSLAKCWLRSAPLPPSLRPRISLARARAHDPPHRGLPARAPRQAHRHQDVCLSQRRHGWGRKGKWRARAATAGSAPRAAVALAMTIHRCPSSPKPRASTERASLSRPFVAWPLPSRENDQPFPIPRKVISPARAARTATATTGSALPLLMPARACAIPSPSLAPYLPSAPRSTAAVSCRKRRMLNRDRRAASPAV